MENDFRPGGPDGAGGRLTSSQARDALDRLGVDGAMLAERVVTPWWYHPALGLIVGALVGFQTLSGSAPIIASALGVVALSVLTTVYSRRYGISINRPAGPRSRRLLLVVSGAFALAMVTALVIRFTGGAPRWGLLPAALAFGAAVMLGRRYDDALRDELARDAGERA